MTPKADLFPITCSLVQRWSPWCVFLSNRSKSGGLKRREESSKPIHRHLTSNSSMLRSISWAWITTLRSGPQWLKASLSETHLLVRRATMRRYNWYVPSTRDSSFFPWCPPWKNVSRVYSHRGGLGRLMRITNAPPNRKHRVRKDALPLWTRLCDFGYELLISSRSEEKENRFHWPPYTCSGSTFWMISLLYNIIAQAEPIMTTQKL